MAVLTYITKPDNQYNRVLLDPYEIILLLFGFAGLYFNLPWTTITCVIAFIFTPGFLRVKEFQRKGAGRALTEHLVFDTENILIASQKYDLNRLKNIKIHVNNYDGEWERIGRSVRRKGIDNILEFEINGNKYNFTFYLESKRMKAELGELLVEWYKSGVTIEESDGQGRTYGLKQLSYKQIRELRHTMAQKHSPNNQAIS